MGTSLSRWTMSYFTAALLALLLAQGLLAAGVGYPAAPLAAPATLIVVHLVTIGWLSLLMAGALLQFVPVLVARRLYSDRLALPALLLLLAGLAALVWGFARLDGSGDAASVLAAGAGLLLAGFGLVLWNLARTLLAAPGLGLPARFVTVGLVALVLVAGLGLILALVRGGATGAEPWVSLAALGVPLHVVAGFGGWLTLTAMGVSYRLLAMFMLAPELERRITHGALYLGTLALVVAVGGGIIAILAGGGPEGLLIAGGGLGLLALGFYGSDIIRLYRQRRRRVIELNSRMAAVALILLAVTVALALGLLVLGRFTAQIGAVVYLLAFGWLGGLGLSQLYKITAFMTWLEVYGPVLGKGPTPRVQDLVVEARARPWFIGYFVAVGLAVLALLAGQGVGFQLAAGLQLVASLGITWQLWRIRRLADIPPATRYPGAARPARLLWSRTG